MSRSGILQTIEYQKEGLFIRNEYCPIEEKIAQGRERTLQIFTEER